MSPQPKTLPAKATPEQLDAFFAAILTYLKTHAPTLASGHFAGATFTLEGLFFSQEPLHHPYIGSTEYMHAWRQAILQDGRGDGKGLPVERQSKPGPHERDFLAEVSAAYAPTIPHAGFEEGAAWQALLAHARKQRLDVFMASYSSAFGRATVMVKALNKPTYAESEIALRVHLQDIKIPLAA